jgi:hypothetical protein
VLGVVPVTQAGQVAVGARLAGVLRGGLAVHLEDARAGPAEHATDQVQVVDLAGRGGGLVGLVEPLQHRRQQSPRRAEQFCGLLDVACQHVADVGHPARRIAVDHPTQLIEAERVRRHILLVVPAVADDLAQQPVHQGQIGTAAHRQMNICLPRHRRRPRIHYQHRGRVRALAAVQHPHPQHYLGLRHVVSP